MCLYPVLMKNKKYMPKGKYSGKTRVPRDPRMLYITAACGKCLECRKQRARDWSIRMQEELKTNKIAYFVGMSLSDKSIKELKKKYKLKNEQNEIAKKALRLWLERVRADTGKSIKHWCITELGHNNTERIHLHGIIWGAGADELLKKHWKYGIVFVGDYVSEKSINYMVKYMVKPDLDHPEFQGQVLCSAGIGKGYEDTYNGSVMNRFQEEDTVTTYRTRDGSKVALPIYYRNKLYTEEERESLWIHRLNKGEIYVMGSKVKAENVQEYYNLLETKQKEASNIMKYDVGEIKTQERLQMYRNMDEYKRRFEEISKLTKEQQKLRYELNKEVDECPF